jgi:RNA polymerase sigma-70 factor (ECF subfamily)
MHTTPVSLLKRLRQPGQAAAWAEFVELYTPVLFAWARRLGMRAEDAADLVQEVFTALVRRLPEFEYDRDKSFRKWLHTVMLNKWRDLGRRRSLPAGNQAALDELPGAASPHALEEAEYRQLLVTRALEIMRADFEPATWQACWELVAEGRPAADVARELGLSANVVYLAKGRVLRRLRAELDGLLD